MKLKLLYKSYATRNLVLKQGDVMELDETEANRLMKTYPKWFCQVSEADLKKPPMGKPEKLDEDEQDEKDEGNLGGGGPHKETKPVKGHITK